MDADCGEGMVCEAEECRMAPMPVEDGPVAGELIITDSYFPFYRWQNLFDLYKACDKLHTIRVNPEHATKVATLYSTPWPFFLLIIEKKRGDFSIVARTASKRYRSPQLQLTEMNWLIES